MPSALVVTRAEKNIAFFAEMIGAADYDRILTSPTAGDARRMMLELDFDLVVINAPLRDESGESLARHIAAKGASQVILVVRSEHFDEVSAVCENDGVLTVAKPLTRTIFWSVLKVARAAQIRLLRTQDENIALTRKIEDIRIVDRAKRQLMAQKGLTEPEAHRLIEKQAMNTRTTKRQVAEGILERYGE